MADDTNSGETGSPVRYDLVVIGGGPAGYGAALYAGAAGMSVALVERDRLGGTCLHRGCIPAKELLETAAVWRTVGEAAEFGVNVEPPELDFAVSQGRKQRIVDGLETGVKGLLRRRKVATYEGTGRLRADRSVEVDAGESGIQTLQGDQVLLAAGSVPITLPGFDRDGTLVMTSDEVLALDEVPSRVAVIGGGAIGCEFASMLADLGAEVTVLEYAPQIIPGVDADIAKALARAFSKRGITVLTGCRVTGHTPDGSGTTVQYEIAPRSGDGDMTEASLEVDAVVVSVGRRPYADHLGLDGTEVKLDERGFVVADEMCRTTMAGVYAIGDLINTPQLAHVGFAEAIVATKDMLGEEPAPVDYANVPWAIYCHPEVAFAGLTEATAREAGYEVVTSKHRFTGNSRAMIVNDTEGLVKIVAEREADGTAGRVLGVHMMGPWVTEQLGQGYLAVNWEATVAEVAALVQPHPTLSELFGETMLSLTGRGLHG
ncbi:dihydrolipoyl dehydrogenase [Candidatus Poriferisodalis sp.]|uniref:dihydrolipoyl dehydrogenase n=1 Tax=Candidatus Poriferisodalis sp. TaxID=3101277 RepID=UPI003B5CC596